MGENFNTEREIITYKREKEAYQMWLNAQHEQMAAEIIADVGAEMDKIVSEGNAPIVKVNKWGKFIDKLKNLWRREY